MKIEVVLGFKEKIKEKTRKGCSFLIQLLSSDSMHILFDWYSQVILQGTIPFSVSIMTVILYQYVGTCTSMVPEQET